MNESQEELGGAFVISVDELGVNGLWTTVKDVSMPRRAPPPAPHPPPARRSRPPHRARPGPPWLAVCRAPTSPPGPARPRPPAAALQLLEARAPVQGLMLSNKFGKPTQVAKLPLT
jgi:hypothetical protein